MSVFEKRIRDGTWTVAATDAIGQANLVSLDITPPAPGYRK